MINCSSRCRYHRSGGRNCQILIIEVRSLKTSTATAVRTAKRIRFMRTLYYQNCSDFYSTSPWTNGSFSWKNHECLQLELVGFHLVFFRSISAAFVFSGKRAQLLDQRSGYFAVHNRKWSTQRTITHDSHAKKTAVHNDSYLRTARIVMLPSTVEQAGSGHSCLDFLESTYSSVS